MALTLKIVTPETLLFEGEIQGVKAPGIDGLFGVLNNHAPMLAALGEGDLTATAAGKDLVFAISGGFLEVNDNVVSVMADTAEQK